MTGSPEVHVLAAEPLPSGRGSETNEARLNGISMQLIPEKLQALHGAGRGN